VKRLQHGPCLPAAWHRVAAVALVPIAIGVFFAAGGSVLNLVGLLPLREMTDLFLVGAVCGGVTTTIVVLTEA
jgi:hypothetical protein